MPYSIREKSDPRIVPYAYVTGSSVASKLSNYSGKHSTLPLVACHMPIATNLIPVLNQIPTPICSEPPDHQIIQGT